MLSQSPQIVNNTLIDLISESYYINMAQYVELCKKLPMVYSSSIIQDNTNKIALMFYYTNRKMLPLSINFLRLFDVNFDLRKCE
jgi:hypothetical protein